MAIATRPKPTVHHKKRRAQHHRRSRLYLKPYWPYLPMIAIIGVGAYVNQSLYSASLGSTGWLSTGAPLAPTRIDVLTGQTGWTALVVVITALAAIIFVAMYWNRVRKVIGKGEKFVVHHPWFDIALVVILTAGVILTRSA